jgi:hypothetical protein
MITKNNRWAVRSSTGRKVEIPSRKFRNQNRPSLAYLQPRRRERLPRELVTILQALTGKESGPIVFAFKREGEGGAAS